MLMTREIHGRGMVHHTYIKKHDMLSMPSLYTCYKERLADERGTRTDIVTSIDAPSEQRCHTPMQACQ